MTVEQETSLDRVTVLRETLLAMFGLGSPDPGSLRAVLRRVAPEDIAAVLSDFEPEEKIAIFKAIPSTEAQAAVLEETDQQSRREILSALTGEERAEILGDMPVDDLVDTLEELPPEEQERIIAGLEREEAEEVRELQQYDPDTAGGMMTTEFLAVPLGTSSAEALLKIQGNLNLEVITVVYVVDEEGVLRGVVSIRDILRARPGTPVDEYMTRDVITVRLDTDREEVAAIVDRYNLEVVPVVDEEGRLRGIVTFDDVMDAVREEHSEDMLRMAGTTAVHPLYEPVLMGAAKRLPFLCITMAGGFGVLLVKSIFDDGDISPALFSVVLAIIPLISGLSGNVAIVTATVIVRGLATGEIAAGRIGRVMAHELAVGFLVGLVVSFAVALLYAWVGAEPFREEVLPLVGLGLCLSVLWASFVGASVPVICKLTRVIDPAIASGPFVAVTCDISASFIFLLLVDTFLAGKTG